MFRKIILVFFAFLIVSCGRLPLMQFDETVVGNEATVDYTQWDVPHTNLTMLLPEGWVTEYHQGDITISTASRNFFYSPSEEFEGVLIRMFLSGAPQAVGPSFDVMGIAEQYIEDQDSVVQDPILVEKDGRQIITTIHLNRDSKGTVVTYLTGYVLENQQLTVFMGATPRDTELLYLPILLEMLYSIEITSNL
jgi:hypothetical protein